VASGTSDANVSTAPSAAKSTATENIRENYQKMKTERVKERTEKEALMDILRGMGLDPTAALKAHQTRMEQEDVSDDEVGADNPTRERATGDPRGRDDHEPDETATISTRLTEIWLARRVLAALVGLPVVGRLARAPTRRNEAPRRLPLR